MDEWMDGDKVRLMKIWSINVNEGVDRWIDG